MIAKLALCARISQEAPTEAPATPGNLIAGAKLYREFCAVCRGMSGAPPTPDYLPPGVSALSTAETTPPRQLAFRRIPAQSRHWTVLLGARQPAGTSTDPAPTALAPLRLVMI